MSDDDCTSAPPRDRHASGVGAGRSREPRAPAAAAGADRRARRSSRGAREVQIEHRGSLYRLKQTALGKLILTK